LIQRNEMRLDVVASCGGPSRVISCLSTFGIEALRNAPQTRKVYDQSARMCFVELRWLEPRHLGAAVRRSIERQATEEDVALELRRALRPDETPKPIQRLPTTSPTANAAIEAVYPSWFLRLLPVDGCDSHLVAFVGAPRGNEARWLELKKVESGWFIVDDQRITAAGWPKPPTVEWCD
ncbi:hypothetical protein ACFL6C_13925, partial [Myxococcota bacterium]